MTQINLSFVRYFMYSFCESLRKSLQTVKASYIFIE